MYEVYWDKVVYMCDDQISYQHTVYEGRFLSQ